MTVQSSSITNDIIKNRSKTPKLIGSCRLTLSILCFFGLIHLVLIRLNFSIALVCMTGTNNVNSTEPGYIEGEFDWDREVVSNLLSSFFYGYILTQILGGYTADILGSKMSLFGGVLILCSTSMLEPIAARTHWGLLLSIRVVQGLSSGFTMPVIYSMFTYWSSPWERATLMAIAYSGISVANIINFPLAGLLCVSGVDGGWPLIFYLPGISGLIWCAAWYTFTYNMPQDHPRISAEELEYLQKYSCKSLAVANESQSDKKKLKIPLLRMLKSRAVHALWITHTCEAWIFYLIALNLPLFVNETFDYGIVLNGLVCAIAYIGTFIFTFSGKLYDIIAKKNIMSVTNLRKVFNSLGMLVPAILFCFVNKYNSDVGKILAFSFAASMKMLASHAGFFMSHSDIAGPFSGLLFGFTNTCAQLAGIVNPLLIAALAPVGTEDEWQKVFYVGAGVATFGAFVYILFGTSERQPWAYIKADAEEEKEET